MKFIFPAIHPEWKLPVGHAEVYVADPSLVKSTASRQEKLPHRRFFLNQVIQAWTIFSDSNHWPTHLCWTPYPAEDRAPHPDEWQGPSANLATLLAVCHAQKSFAPERIKAEQIWATGGLSSDGSLVSVSLLAEKLLYFYHHCLHTKTTPVFLVPLEHQPEVQEFCDKFSHPFDVVTFHPALDMLTSATKPTIVLLPSRPQHLKQFITWAQATPPPVPTLFQDSVISQRMIRWSLVVGLLVAGLWLLSHIGAHTSPRWSSQQPQFQSPPKQKMQPTDTAATYGSTASRTHLAAFAQKDTGSPAHSTMSPQHAEVPQPRTSVTKYVPIVSRPAQPTRSVKKVKIHRMRRPIRRTVAAVRQHGSVSSSNHTIPSDRSVDPDQNPVHSGKTTRHCHPQEVELHLSPLPSTIYVQPFPHRDIRPGIHCLPLTTRQLNVEHPYRQGCICRFSTKLNPSHILSIRLQTAEESYDTKFLRTDYCCPSFPTKTPR